jgi:exonuclease SbcD
MQILHTSDWHLGKKLFGLDRDLEHGQFLDWLLETIITRKIDCLVVAGDIFDTPNPPHASLMLFTKFLSKLRDQTSTHLILIAGNHDSGLMLDSFSPLISKERFHIVGSLQKISDLKVEKTFNGKKVNFVMLPFFRPYEIYRFIEDLKIADLKNFRDKLESFYKSLQTLKSKDSMNILVSHHHYGDISYSGSEQYLALEDMNAIPLNFIQGYDFVLLGHLHSSQSLSESPRISYSGSPIPMRFSERNNKKINIISNGVFESVNIPVFRELIQIKCNLHDYQELIESKLKNNKSNSIPSIVEVLINLDEPVAGLADTMKELIQSHGAILISFLPSFKENESPSTTQLGELIQKSPIELFESFYKEKYPESQGIPPEIRQDFIELLKGEIQ